MRKMILLILLLSISCGQESVKKYVVPKDGLKMYADNKFRSWKICTVPYRASVKILKTAEENRVYRGRYGKWVRVQWEDKKGWVFGGLLSDRVPGSSGPAYTAAERRRNSARVMAHLVQRRPEKNLFRIDASGRAGTFKLGQPVSRQTIDAYGMVSGFAPPTLKYKSSGSMTWDCGLFAKLSDKKDKRNLVNLLITDKRFQTRSGIRIGTTKAFITRQFPNVSFRKVPKKAFLPPGEEYIRIGRIKIWLQRGKVRAFELK